MLKNYFLVSFRNISRQKIFSLINISGLTLGIFTSLLILLWVRHEFSYNSFHSNQQRIYRVLQRGEDHSSGSIYGNPSLPYALIPILQEEFPGIENAVRVRNLDHRMFSFEDKVFFEDHLLLAEPSFFQIFDFPLLQGNRDKPFHDLYSVVISQETARKYFGEEEAIGRILKFEGRLDFTVTGIIANCPENSTLNYDLIIPFAILGEERLTSWSWESSGYILLSKQAFIEDLRPQVQDIIVKYRPENENEVALQSLDRIHLYNTMDEPERLIVVLSFLAIGIFVMLIACINFMNLSTARSITRAREVGMRKVLGSRRQSLIWQFLIESVLLVLIATVIAVILAELVLPYFNGFIGSSVTLNLNNISDLALIALLVAITAFLAGGYPALLLSSYQPVIVLKGAILNRSRNHLRKILVVLQFTIAVIMIISTLTVFRQLEYIRHKDLGFRRDSIVSIPANRLLNEKYYSFREEILSHPGIAGITRSSSDPSYIGNVNPAYWTGKQTDETILFNFYLTDTDFLDVFEIELLAGSNFLNNEPREGFVPYLVNQRALEVMGMTAEEAVGSRFTMYDVEGEIIGVVKDFHFQPLQNTIRPLMITNLDWWKTRIYLKLKPGDLLSTMSFIEEKFRQFAPEHPFQSSFLDEDVAAQYSDLRQVGVISRYFTLLAIIISCLGLFGLASCLTEARTREIGIRKVLGSRIISIIWLLVKDFTRWVLLANCLALPAAWFLSRELLQNYAFHAEMKPWPFILTLAGTLGIAILSVAFQTLQAAGANPVKALKYE